MTAIPKFDKRRSRYVPLDVFVAFDEFGTKLVEKWGMEGLCCWMLLLAAAKREVTQGLFTYTSDDEAWSKLGARPEKLTLDEFLRYTGQCKKTSKRRSGRITYVKIRTWDKWNTHPGSQQNSRSDHENTDGLRANTNGLRANARAEVEGEGEVEVERTRALPSTETSASAPETNGTALDESVGEQVLRSLETARKAAA